MEPQTQNTKVDVDQLNAFLQEELSAIASYQQCIEKIEKPQLASTLTDLQESHQKRASLLSNRIQEMGGAPNRSSGTWGSFAKLVERGAAMFGEKSAVSALEEGEDRGKASYKSGTEKLSPENQSFINTEIIPEHYYSHDTMSRLKHTMH